MNVVKFEIQYIARKHLGDHRDMAFVNDPEGA